MITLSFATASVSALVVPALYLADTCAPDEGQPLVVFDSVDNGLADEQVPGIQAWKVIKFDPNYGRQCWARGI